MDAQEPAARQGVADQRVVAKGEGVVGPDVAFGAVRDEYRVLRPGALANGVAGDVRDAAVGQVDLVGGLAARTVDDVVIADIAAAGARLDQVTAIAVLETAAGDGNTGDAADVEQMRQRVHLARCVGEAAVLDGEFGIAVVAGENAHLIVDESAVVQGQLAAFETDAGPVAGRDARAAEFDVLDVDVAVADDPDGLAFGMLAVGDENRPLADAADRECFLFPDGDIAAIFAGQDFDGIAVPGQFGCIGDAGDRQARTHVNRIRMRGEAMTKDQCCDQHELWRVATADS